MSLIPKRFRAATADSYQPVTASQQAALRAVLEWLSLVSQGRGPMLALIGKQGTGKSHLLYAAVRKILEGRPQDQKAVIESGWVPPYSRAWYQLADELRYGDGRGDSHQRVQEVRRKLWEARIVLIDEVRPTSGTSFDDTELAKFACHAYDNEIPVLLTTNVKPLENVMGDAAASRFRQVVIDGPDWRDPEQRKKVGETDNMTLAT